MSEPSKLGYGVSGWKARQEHSRRRMHRNSDERANIRAIRRQHKLDTAAHQHASEKDAEEAISPAAEKLPTVTIIGHGRGWYSVEVDGNPVTDGKVREAEAQAIAEGYSNE